MFEILTKHYLTTLLVLNKQVLCLCQQGKTSVQFSGLAGTHMQDTVFYSFNEELLADV